MLADGTAATAGEHGGLVGFFDAVYAQPVTIHVTTGDTTVHYTDGLTEVPAPHLVDTDQTIDLIRTCCTGGADAQTVAERLEAVITERLRIQNRPDDIALLVLFVR